MQFIQATHNNLKPGDKVRRKLNEFTGIVSLKKNEIYTVSSLVSESSLRVEKIAGNWDIVKFEKLVNEIEYEFY